MTQKEKIGRVIALDEAHKVRVQSILIKDD